MPRGFRLTPLAAVDIDDIWNFIAGDSTEAADRVEAAIVNACDQLARNPQIGSRRPEFKRVPGLRFWTLPRYPNYTVAYYPETKPLQVVAILHGKRDFRRALQGRQIS